MDNRSHDQLPGKSPETGSLDSLDERSYSSSAAVPLEQLERIDGKPLDITNVDGGTPEEKFANLQAEAEGRKSAHLILRREVGPFHAEVRRGWDEDTKKQYENLMVREATKSVKLPEFGETTLTNIRVGRDEGPDAKVPYWGSAEFDTLNIPRPPQETYAELLEEARSEVGQGERSKKVVRTFDFEGRTITLEVSSNPADHARWGGRDFHLWTHVAFDDNPEIFRAVLPSLSLGKHEPNERPLAGYAMSLRHIDVNLDDDREGAMGRAFFTYSLIDRSEVPREEPAEGGATAE